MRRLFFAAAVLALASGGCATGHAKTAPVPTPLDVPAPPPRIIVSPGPEVSPPQVQGINTDSEKPKPAPKPSGPPPDVKPETPPPADPPVVTALPAATLQQTQSGKAAETLARQQVRQQLDRARVDLNRVNPRALNPDEKSQYDTAQRFVAEAEQALNEGNLLVAAKVAEKAAGLAAGLPVR